MCCIETLLSDKRVCLNGAMTQKTSWSETHLDIVATMVRVPVVGGKHKQKSTIKNWAGEYDGDVLDDAIKDLINAGVIREKGRGTITLRSVETGKEFLEKFDENDEYVWFYSDIG